MNKQSSKVSEQLKKTVSQSERLCHALQTAYNQQKQSFQSIETDIQQTVDIFKKKFEECETNLYEIQVQWDKVRKFTNQGPGFLNAKSEQIKSKTKNIDAVSTGIKQTVSRIKPENLVELEVQKFKPLQHLFKCLFAVLYHKKQDDFEWKSFKQLALLLENGEDFISRLVNVHFKDLKHDEYQMLLILKNDPEFDHASTSSEYAAEIIDLADWVEYACAGHKFSEEKKEAEKAYDKIRKDMHRRQGGSLEVSKKFWKEALEQVDKFQMSLVSLDSEVKAFQILTQSSLDDINQRVEKRNTEIASLN